MNEIHKYFAIGAMVGDPDGSWVHIKEHSAAIEQLQTDLAEEQSRRESANNRRDQEQREMDDMTRRYTAAAEMNKRLLEQIKADHEHSACVCKLLAFIDEYPPCGTCRRAAIIAGAEAALAKEVPHV